MTRAKSGFSKAMVAVMSLTMLFSVMAGMNLTVNANPAGSVLVIFNPNGGTIDGSSEPIEHWAQPGQRLTQPTAVVAPAGRQFVGWDRVNPTPVARWDFNNELPNVREFELRAVWQNIPVQPTPPPNNPVLPRPTQNVIFERHFFDTSGNPMRDERQMTITQGTGIPTTHATLNNSRPLNISGNWNGATGGATFTSWWQDPNFERALTTTNFQTGAANPRRIPIYARYRRELQFHTRTLQDTANTTNRSRYIHIDYPGASAQNTTGLYNSPVENTIMRDINLPHGTGSITVRAPHEFAAWATVAQPRNNSAILDTSNDVTARVRQGSVEGFVFPTDGVLPIHAWYRLIQGDTHQVTFVYNNLSEPQQRVLQVPHNSEIRGYRPPVIPGSHFVGWYRQFEDGSFDSRAWTDQNGNALANRGFTEDITLVARFEFRITFDLNRGMLNGSNTVPSQLNPIRVRVAYPTIDPSIHTAIGERNFDQVIAQLNGEPSMHNAIFIGWYTHRDGFRLIRPGENVIQSEQLSAMFLPNPWNDGGGGGGGGIGGPIDPDLTPVTIRYNLHNGSGILTQRAFEGLPFPNVAAYPHIPTRTGHVFRDWIDSETGLSIDWNTVVARDGMTIYATWWIDYGFEFMVHGQIVTEAFINRTENTTLALENLNSSVRHDIAPSERNPDRIRPHHDDRYPNLPVERFTGWRIVDRNGNTLVEHWDTTTPLPVTQEMFGAAATGNAVNTRITLIAQWIDNPMVTLVGGANHTESFPTFFCERRENYFFTFPDPPEFRGQIFAGWNTCIGVDRITGLPCEDCNGVWVNANTPFPENTTLHARWSNAGYSVHFVVNNGDTEIRGIRHANSGETVNPPLITCPEDGSIIAVVSWHREPDFSDPAINFSLFPITETVTIFGRLRDSGSGTGSDPDPIMYTVTLLNPLGNVIGSINVEPNSTLRRSDFVGMNGIPPTGSTFTFDNNWFFGIRNVPEQDSFANPGTRYGIPLMHWIFDGYAGVTPDRVNSNLYLLAGAVHNITLNANHPNHPAVPTQRIIRGENATLPTLTLPGYRFLGWSTSREEGEGQMWDADIRIWSHITLFALWEEVIEPPPEEVIYEMSILVEDFTYVGYVVQSEDGISTITFTIPRTKIDAAYARGRGITGSIYHLLTSAYNAIEFSSASNQWTHIQEIITFTSNDVVRVAGEGQSAGEFNRQYVLQIVPMETVTSDFWMVPLGVSHDTRYAGLVYRRSYYPDNGFYHYQSLQPSWRRPNIDDQSCWNRSHNEVPEGKTYGDSWYDPATGNWYHVHPNGGHMRVAVKGDCVIIPPLYQLCPPFNELGEDHRFYLNDLFNFYHRLQSDVTIRFTLDGSDPTVDSDLYLYPIRLDQLGRIEIRARAFLDGWEPSDIAVYVIYVNELLPVDIAVNLEIPLAPPSMEEDETPDYYTPEVEEDVEENETPDYYTPEVESDVEVDETPDYYTPEVEEDVEEDETPDYYTPEVEEDVEENETPDYYIPEVEEDVEENETPDYYIPEVEEDVEENETPDYYTPEVEEDVEEDETPDYYTPEVEEDVEEDETPDYYTPEVEEDVEENETLDYYTPEVEEDVEEDETPDYYTPENDEDVEKDETPDYYATDENTNEEKTADTSNEEAVRGDVAEVDENSNSTEVEDSLSPETPSSESNTVIVDNGELNNEERIESTP